MTAGQTEDAMTRKPKKGTTAESTSGAKPEGAIDG